MRGWRGLTGTAPAAHEGDFETKAAKIFEIKSGETTSVTLDCGSPGGAE
jgi:hypothetical protein